VGGLAGDGGPALAAELDQPGQIALDPFGNLFIADGYNNRIRRVDTSTGKITTVAGSTPPFTPGYAGDGGPATSAKMFIPFGVAVDATGNIYIADTGNSCIRKVAAATGIITTVAGNGVPGFSGDGGPAVAAQLSTPIAVTVHDDGLYIADEGNNRIRQIDLTTGIISTAAGDGVPRFLGDGGAATSAVLTSPQWISVDRFDNLYFADISEGRIRRVDAVTGAISTAAGPGLPALDGVATDASSNLYVPDRSGARVFRIDAKTGAVAPIAGTGVPGYFGDGGQALSAKLSAPSAVAVDALGNIFIADAGNLRVRRIDASSGVITTFAGTGVSGTTGDGGAATSATFKGPACLAVDAAGDVFISDATASQVRRVDAATGVITTVAGTGTNGFLGDGGPATSAQLSFPYGVAVDPVGNVFIADQNSNRVRRVDGTTHIITSIAGSVGMSASKGDGGPGIDAVLATPTGVAADAHGNVYANDSSGECIRRIDATTGVITTFAGPVDPEGMGPVSHAQLADPRALIVSPPLTLFAGGSSGTVQVLRSDRDRLTAAVGRYRDMQAIADRARYRGMAFGDVTGIAYDPSAHLIYLSETARPPADVSRIDVVTMVDPDDSETWTIEPLASVSGARGFADGDAASAQFSTPSGLYLDDREQRLLIADADNHVVRAIGLTEATVTTIAGTPETPGFDGDGGPATSALLASPKAITRCANGDVFIADTGNNRVRRIAAATGIISTVLGDGVAASSGKGIPASSFPVDRPLGLACDTSGNLLVTSSTAVRLVGANTDGVVDGSRRVQTIYGAAPRVAFPENLTSCLSGLAILDAATIQIVDSCTGMLIQLTREISRDDRPSTK
jgi:sugar lactone lactonase YvrE